MTGGDSKTTKTSFEVEKPSSPTSNGVEEKKRNLGVEDFGYSFVGYEPPSAAYAMNNTATATDTAGLEADEEARPFIYRPSSEKTNLDEAETSPNEKFFFTLAGVACTLTVLTTIIGGVLTFIGHRNDEDDPDDGLENKTNTYTLIGGILLVVSTGTCFCCFLNVCMACCSACISEIREGDSSNKKKDKYGGIKLQLRKLNDTENYHDVQSNMLQKVRLNVVSSIKVFQKASDKEKAQLKKEQDKQTKQLEQLVKQDLEDGMLASDVVKKYRPVAFLIDFQGDSMVNSMDLLRKQISFVVHTAKPGVDRAIVIVTSGGGSVAHYGLATSQLVRIRKAGIHLTVCIDTIAASGGFMMATVANDICAAPFAIVGSIGVVTAIPNFQRFLQNKDIDAYLFTSGKYKRTIDLIGDVTEEGKAKLQSQLDDIHTAFQDHVSLARPKLSDRMADVSTGEHWLAVQAKELGLVDVIMTSDELLDQLIQNKQYDVIQIIQKKNKYSDIFDKFSTRLGSILPSSSTLQQQQTYNPMIVS